MTNRKANNYVLHVRKSSESRERQEASLEDQKTELTALANRLGLNVVEFISEAKSAKMPGRDGFTKLLQLIDSGKVDGILCWKLNRLSRNPIDGGEIQWRLQNGQIKHIQTHSNSYYPEDNVIQMQVELGMATQYVRDLAQDVCRGTRQKAERGWYPSRCPVGYLHRNKHVRTQGEDEIISDPETFDKMLLLWKLLLEGKTSLMGIFREAQAIGVVTPRTKNLTYNGLQMIFRNEFYCGYFYWKNKEGVKIRHKGKHKAMITEVEFRKAQMILSKNVYNKRPDGVKNNLFSNCFKCQLCQYSYVADKKEQTKCTQCKTKFSSLRKKQCPKCSLPICKMDAPWSFKRTYYKCVGKKHGCLQPQSYEEEMKEALKKTLRKLKFNDDFVEFYSRLISYYQENGPAQQDEEKISILKKELTLNRNRLTKLLTSHLDGIIDPETYTLKKVELDKRISEVENQIEELSSVKLSLL